MIFNRCLDCGRRIKRRKRTIFGMPYKPVSCMACVEERDAWLYGSKEDADLAWLHALRSELERVP